MRLPFFLALAFAHAASAGDIQPVRAHEIEPYRAAELKPVGRAGVDPLPGAPARSDAIAGDWEIAIPGVATTTQTDDGVTRTTTTRVGVGAGLGRLSIRRDGRYRWTSRSGVHEGRIEAVRPRRDADPALRYFRVEDGSQEYYFARTGEELTLYSPATNLYAATGKRASAARRR